MYRFIIFFHLSFFFVILNPISADANRPDHLIDLKNQISSVKIEMKYFTSENFLGRKVKGYSSNTCYLTPSAARALAEVQADLKSKNLGLILYDCYRPPEAVADFVEWSKDPKDQKRKSEHYPQIDKRDLFAKGYISSRSTHTTGNTVDLGLVDAKSLEVLDMGSPYDFFGEISHTKNSRVSKVAKKNRSILVKAMEQQGFKNYKKEWWHFEFSTPL